MDLLIKNILYLDLYGIVKPVIWFIRTDVDFIVSSYKNHFVTLKLIKYIKTNTDGAGYSVYRHVIRQVLHGIAIVTCCQENVESAIIFI